MAELGEPACPTRPVADSAQLVLEGGVPTVSPSMVPWVAEYSQTVELAHLRFPYRGKKKKKRNGEREVRIYSFFHESHGRSKQARQRAAVLEPMDRGSCQLVLGVVTHVERAREPGRRHRYRERQ